MSKKLLSLTLSTLVAASSASFTNVFAAKDGSSSPESDQTTVAAKDDSASPESDQTTVAAKDDSASSESDQTTVAAKDDSASPESDQTTVAAKDDSASPESDQTTVAAKDNSASPESDSKDVITMKVSSEPFTFDHADSNSNNKADDESKKSDDNDSEESNSVKFTGSTKRRRRRRVRDEGSPKKKRYKSSDSSSSSSDNSEEEAEILPPPAAQPKYKTLEQVLLKKYAECSATDSYFSTKTENTGWVFKNKALPSSCSAYYYTPEGECKQGIKHIEVFNKYFRLTIGEKAYVMLLPTFMMVKQSGLSIEEVKERILNPENWEFKKVDDIRQLYTYNSTCRNEGIIKSLDEYIAIITPRTYENRG